MSDKDVARKDAWIKKHLSVDEAAWIDRPNLGQINQFGVSGGKDSTALLLWAIHRSGYEKASIRVTFCDTGNEAPETYEHIRTLSGYCVANGIEPIVWLTPERQFYELCIHKQIFPSVKRRFCTTELKLVPSRDYCYSLEAQGYRVLVHTGVRAGERSTGKNDRSKLGERDIDTFSGLPVYRPLLRWTLDDVWAIHEEFGVPRNPLYALGMSRVGCFPCIMSKKLELRRIAVYRPGRVVFLREKSAMVAAACRHDHPEMVRSFFHSGTVPKRWRTGPEVTTKKGEKMRIATVDDVFRWALTARGGSQLNWDEADYGDMTTCAGSSGACE